MTTPDPKQVHAFPWQWLSSVANGAGILSPRDCELLHETAQLMHDQHYYLEALQQMCEELTAITLATADPKEFIEWPAVLDAARKNREAFDAAQTDAA